MARRVEVNVARSLETGTILGVLVITLTVTGLLLSPTMSTLFPTLRLTQAAANTLLYVIHLSSAALVIAFSLWHLMPWRHSFTRKRGVTPWWQVASFTLLALVAVQVITGSILYFHLYGTISKRTAVLVHLLNAFVVLTPLAIHSWKGMKAWRKRRHAQGTAMKAATKAGRAEKMKAQQDAQSRRAFIRIMAYAGAGVGLALAFGKYTAGQLAAWRLNFVGDTPRLAKESYLLTIKGLVAKPIELTFAQLTALPTETVRLTHHCVEGWTYTDDFTGTRLTNVLALAGGVNAGAAQLVFRSPEVSKQGQNSGQKYSANFPVGGEDDVWIIWKVGGEDLPADHGFPVRMMTPRKWGYKACKWLTEIEAINDPEYRGYWERQGYHNVGDYPGPIFA